MQAAGDTATRSCRGCITSTSDQPAHVESKRPAMLQTPEATRPRSATATWAADLDAYIGSHEASPGSSSTETRQRLVAGVKASPQSAEAWRALLAHEESHGSNMTHGLQADPGRVSLYHIYYWATTLVPRSSSKIHKEAYLQLWLGFARQQW
eukprot:GHRQ01021138.1.p1 GENE.GHRQ01021138.1~~GHRQ01021138.1.p1  ORF type:complete len:169 (+),score=62.37 GHRQ01021138.1:53-508(+)